MVHFDKNPPSLSSPPTCTDDETNANTVSDAATLINDPAGPFLSRILEKKVRLTSSMENTDIMNTLAVLANIIQELKICHFVTDPLLYLKLFEEVKSILNQFCDHISNNKEILHLQWEDLFEWVQYIGDLLPRLYLLISIGSVIIHHNNNTNDSNNDNNENDNKINAKMEITEKKRISLLNDIWNFCKSVQNPLRGLFCRYYLFNLMEDIILDEKSDRLTPSEKIEFLMNYLIECITLWIRHSFIGSSKDRSLRLIERSNMVFLFEKSIQIIGQLNEKYNITSNQNTIAAILQEVEACKDPMAQEYLLRMIIDHFSVRSLYSSLMDILKAIELMEQSVKIEPLYQSLIYRLVNGRNELECFSSESLENRSSEKVVPHIFYIDLFDIFLEGLNQILQNRPTLSLTEWLQLSYATVHLIMEKNASQCQQIISLYQLIDDRLIKISMRQIDDVLPSASTILKSILLAPFNSLTFILEHESWTLVLSKIQELIEKYYSIAAQQLLSRVLAHQILAHLSSKDTWNWKELIRIGNPLLIITGEKEIRKEALQQKLKWVDRTERKIIYSKPNNEENGTAEEDDTFSSVILSPLLDDKKEMKTEQLIFSTDVEMIVENHLLYIKYLLSILNHASKDEIVSIEEYVRYQCKRFDFSGKFILPIFIDIGMNVVRSFKMTKMIDEQIIVWMRVVTQWICHLINISTCDEPLVFECTRLQSSYEIFQTRFCFCDNKKYHDPVSLHCPAFECTYSQTEKSSGLRPSNPHSYLSQFFHVELGLKYLLEWSVVQTLLGFESEGLENLSLALQIYEKDISRSQNQIYFLSCFISSILNIENRLSEDLLVEEKKKIINQDLNLLKNKLVLHSSQLLKKPMAASLVTRSSYMFINQADKTQFFSVVDKCYSLWESYCSMSISSTSSGDAEKNLISIMGLLDILEVLHVAQKHDKSRGLGISQKFTQYNQSVSQTLQIKIKELIERDDLTQNLVLQKKLKLCLFRWKELKKRKLTDRNELVIIDRFTPDFNKTDERIQIPQKENNDEEITKKRTPPNINGNSNNLTSYKDETKKSTPISKSPEMDNPMPLSLGDIIVSDPWQI